MQLCFEVADHRTLLLHKTKRFKSVELFQTLRRKFEVHKLEKTSKEYFISPELHTKSIPQPAENVVRITRSFLI